MHARYFTRAELFETLSSTRTLLDKQLQKKTYKYKNGAIYTGEWAGGFRYGKGRMDWSDGASFEGEWVLGYGCGKGVFTDCLGNRYMGDFWLSMAHGKGNYTNTLGAVYEGDWKFDMQHGQGVEKWLNSGSYFKG